MTPCVVVSTSYARDVLAPVFSTPHARIAIRAFVFLGLPIVCERRGGKSTNASLRREKTRYRFCSENRVSLLAPRQA